MVWQDVVGREVEEVPMQRRVADGKRCQEHGYNVLGYNVLGERHPEVQVKAIKGDERGDIGCGLFATKDLASGRVLGIYSGALVLLEDRQVPLAGYIQRKLTDFSLTKPMEKIDQVCAHVREGLFVCVPVCVCVG